MTVSDWVLSKFSPWEMQILRDEIYPIVSEKIIHWI
jgi:peptidyl-tRNA hydrolase